MNITCIGHITRDKIVTPLGTSYLAGGTATYAAMGINSLLSQTTGTAQQKLQFHLIASHASEDNEISDDMRNLGINVDVIPSHETSFFENIYGENSNDRRQNVRSIGDPFTTEKLRTYLEPLLKEEQRPYIILGSLMVSDFNLETVKYCSQFGHLVMDAQGYFRQVEFIDNPDGSRIGKVNECNWEKKEEFLSFIDILKLNENEARLITNEPDLHRAAWQLHQQGIKEVLLTLGRDGSIVAANGELIDIPAVPERQSIDATGCGDTYVIAYIYRRALGDDPRSAALFASAAATCKLESTGPLRASEVEVYNRLS